MIYITGDCHSDFRKFNTKNFPEQKEMTKDDYVIICGDFGVIWDAQESREEKWWLDWLDEKTYTTLFIDGNHENFDRLYTFPEKEWHGGQVHEIRPSILHLMRGQVFTIEGKAFWTFGGAQSHDMIGGVLNRSDPNFDQKRKRLEKDWIPYRIEGETWWPQELPSREEMEEGKRNLEAYDNRVDYIITHCCASCLQEYTGRAKVSPDILTDYLDEIRGIASYDKWFFGHYHDDRRITETDIQLYDTIIRIL